MTRSVLFCLATACTALAACSANDESIADDDSFGDDDSPSASSSGAGGSSGSNGSSGGSSGSSGGSSSSSGGSSSSSGGSGSNGSNKPNCKFEAHATGLKQFQQAGGVSFHTYAPASYDPEIGHRVVVIMHSQDSDGTGELQAFWKDLADQENLVLVAPKGTRASSNPQLYPNGANYAAQDTPKIAQLIPLIDDCFNVDPKRHILWGFSEGGHYGYLLGIGAAKLFSGLAMGGANTGFARDNGYPPSAAEWKVPVSHVHGALDQNPIALTYQDRDDFRAAGHVFTLHEHPAGHVISVEQVRQQWNDLKDSQSP